jgi:hypothetical protein
MAIVSQWQEGMLVIRQGSGKWVARLEEGCRTVLRTVDASPETASERFGITRVVIGHMSRCGDESVGTVTQIRKRLEAGISTEKIAFLQPCVQV